MLILPVMNSFSLSIIWRGLLLGHPKPNDEACLLPCSPRPKPVTARSLNRHPSPAFPSQLETRKKAAQKLELGRNSFPITLLYRSSAVATPSRRLASSSYHFRTSYVLLLLPICCSLAAFALTNPKYQHPSLRFSSSSPQAASFHRPRHSLSLRPVSIMIPAASKTK